MIVSECRKTKDKITPGAETRRSCPHEISAGAVPAADELAIIYHISYHKAIRQHYRTGRAGRPSFSVTGKT